MALTQPYKDKIKKLKQEYDFLRQGKDALLELIEEAEIPEMVYNSNAIENSTLTLKETERILLEMDVSRDVSLREVFEAKNLARVVEYIRKRVPEEELSEDMLLLLHQMLLGNISDSIAGRFRSGNEFVRVGTHIAPSPDVVIQLVDDALAAYSSEFDEYFLDKIARFHLEFETIHPFNDGNGRIGRVVINYQLKREGFPGIIIRDKEKQTYYSGFHEYRDDAKTSIMEKVIALGLIESLHKRLAYLKSYKIIPLAEFASIQQDPAPIWFNAAKRQTIPAFREKGVWKIPAEYTSQN